MTTNPVQNEQGKKSADEVPFTPGPWLKLAHDEYVGEWGIRDKDDWRICSVHGFCNANKSNSDDEETDANARLIAAAPALYEAAERVLTALREARDSHPEAWDNCVTPNICTAWDRLRAALALVQGQEKD